MFIDLVLSIRIRFSGMYKINMLVDMKKKSSFKLQNLLFLWSRAKDEKLTS